MIRATLDTNVLASGVASAELLKSTTGAILEYWISGRFELVVSLDILEELERTLGKPYFCGRRSQAQIDEALQNVATEATFVEPTIDITGVASHPEDDLILAAAVSASVDFLVTGDKPLQRLGIYEHVRIVSPREFLAVLEALGDEDP